MDEQCTGTDRTELLTGLDALSKAVDTIQFDDLTGLAKMHGYCDSIAETLAAQSTEKGPMQEQLRGLAHSLEALILGEAEDAADSMRTIQASILALNELAASCSVVADTSGASDSYPVSAQEEADAAPETAPEDADRATVEEFAGTPKAIAENSTPDTTPVAADETAEATEPSAAKPPYVSEPLLIESGELEFLKGFVEETYEHIEAVEAAVLDVEQDFKDISRIDDLFRPFHTIKGMAGFLNLRDVNCLTHEVETLLDLGRKGKKTIDSVSIDLVFEVVDVLKAQVAEISAYIDNPTGTAVPQPPVEELIARLRDFISESPKSEGAGDLAAAPEPAAPSAEVPLVPDAKSSPPSSVSLPQKETPIADAVPPAQPVNSPPTAQAKSAPSQTPAKSSRPVVVSERSVRIETSKLDAMVDMVGELVIAQTLVTGNTGIMTDPKVTRDVSQVTKIIRDIQAVAMGMRMVPVGPTFQKMARLVRDVSRKAGKTVELHISGEDTELDKNVIEQIGDPLVHMIRNACDHGIEPPDRRHAAGKDAIGNVWLRAAHQGGNIVIEIQDDGKGLDSKKLIAKGIERGIVQPGQELTDQQAYQLIFNPGFSMAAQVTDISGRGVGMDVVKRNLEQLRGTVDITSEIGVGSTFSIRLPLTLAIIDGMIVRVGSERFIIPTIVIEQSLRPKQEQLTTVQGRGELLNIRGKLIPLIQLGELFSLAGRVDPCEAMVVTAECEGRSIGLVVEQLIGQQQVVIKSLGQRFERLRGISGAAILGDGKVGLIIEMGGLVAAHAENKFYSRIPSSALSDDEPQNADSPGEAVLT